MRSVAGDDGPAFNEGSTLRLPIVASRPVLISGAFEEESAVIGGGGRGGCWSVSCALRLKDIITRLGDSIVGLVGPSFGGLGVVANP